MRKAVADMITIKKEGKEQRVSFSALIDYSTFEYNSNQYVKLSGVAAYCIENALVQSFTGNPMVKPTNWEVTVTYK